MISEDDEEDSETEDEKSTVHNFFGQQKCQKPIAKQKPKAKPTSVDNPQDKIEELEIAHKSVGASCETLLGIFKSQKVQVPMLKQMFEKSIRNKHILETHIKTLKGTATSVDVLGKLRPKPSKQKSYRDFW